MHDDHSTYQHYALSSKWKSSLKVKEAIPDCCHALFDSGGVVVVIDVGETPDSVPEYALNNHNSQQQGSHWTLI